MIPLKFKPENYKNTNETDFREKLGPLSVSVEDLDSMFGGLGKIKNNDEYAP